MEVVHLLRRDLGSVLFGQEVRDGLVASCVQHWPFPYTGRHWSCRELDWLCRWKELDDLNKRHSEMALVVAAEMVLLGVENVHANLTSSDRPQDKMEQVAVDDDLKKRKLVLVEPEPPLVKLSVSLQNSWLVPESLVLAVSNLILERILALVGLVVESQFPEN